MKHFRNLNFTVIVLASVLISTTPAVAGKKVGISGTIELNSWESVPSYGGQVTFLTDVIGRLSSQSRTYVSVVCLQQDTVVYQWSADRDFVFPLEDQPGQGLEWDGGDAACTGTLIYREDKGRKITIMFLDDTVFDVQGTAS